MTNRKISRALLSVSDKTGLIDFAKEANRRPLIVATPTTA